MTAIWNVVNGLQINKSKKNIIYLGVLIISSILIGGVIWLLLGRMLLPGIDWLICFMGYPAMFVGLFGGILYLYNHEFEN